MLADELAELVGHLRELDRDVVDLLISGVGADTVAGRLGVAAPASVAQWFAWCNGVEVRPGQIQDDVNVIPGYSPLSISDAVELRSSYGGDEVLGDDWVPLLGTAGGDLYAAVWRPGEEAVVAGVLVGEPTEIEFADINQMVSVFNECYRERAYFISPLGRLDMDPGAYDIVYSRIVGS